MYKLGLPQALVLNTDRHLRDEILNVCTRVGLNGSKPQETGGDELKLSVAHWQIAR